MSLDAIIEQNEATERLRAFAASGRVPGSLLFVGPWGVGKTRTALTFARALECLERDDDACDACLSCRKALKFAHPDIRFLFPMSHSQKRTESAKKEEEEQLEAEALRAFSEDPFHIIQFDRNPSIWVERVQELRRAAAMTAAEGRCKVFVLREVDRMSPAQANTILKILEEPPADTHFVLTTARPQALLPTVVSRCQRVDFTPLGRDAITRVLVEERGLDATDARFCAALAQGSLGRALQMVGEDVRGLRDQALAILAAAERGGSHLHAVVEAVSKQKDRNLIRRLAHAMAVWHGDLLRVRYGLGEEQIANVDKLGELRTQAASIDVEEIQRRLELFERLRVAMDQNAGYQVSMYWLMAGLADPEATADSLLVDA
jgi:DNA polymerase-3 subunit delta'